MTHSAPRHAGVRNESPARVGAPHQQRKPPSMASRRRRAGRHAGRKRWGLPSARADQGRRPHARSRSSARARCADPRSRAGAAHAETRARAGKLPWPKKPARTNLLTLRPGDKPRPRAGFRTGHSRAARKGPPRPLAASPTDPHHMIAARRRCPGSHIAIAPELPPRVLAAPLRVAQLVSARLRHDAVGCKGTLPRTSRSWRTACAAVFAVTSSAAPCGSNRGPTRRDGSRATRQRSRLGTPSPSRRAVDAPTWRSSRWAGFVGPGVTAYLAPHFACLLRQSRNSWNSSGLAAGGLPASPCCCFIKSLNFARSSGSCAFLSSHS